MRERLAALALAFLFADAAPAAIAQTVPVACVVEWAGLDLKSGKWGARGGCGWENEKFVVFLEWYRDELAWNGLFGCRRGKCADPDMDAELFVDGNRRRLRRGVALLCEIWEGLTPTLHCSVATND